MLDIRPRTTFLPVEQPVVASARDVLVCIFLRGGADGLNMVVPHGDRDYYRHRPELAITGPGVAGAAIDLDGFFGLHPALAPLMEIWNAKQLAAIHACGSPDPTHSHFDAMDTMERGTPGTKQETSGWLARHLAATRSDDDSILRAVGFGALLPGSLRGGAATALTSLDGFRLKTRPIALPKIAAAHGQIYQGPGLLASAGRQTLETMALIEKITGVRKSQPYRPADGTSYPGTPYGNALKQAAQLIKADVGVEVICADLGDWDTHVNQGGVEGELAANLTELANGLAALYTDLSASHRRLTIVTMSEFGRRTAENGGGGTDHGHGNVMLALGGNIAGGKVYGEWPGLEDEQLYGPGDLAITTDFRDVLGEVVAKRLANPALEQVFPGRGAFSFRGIAQG